MTPMEAFCWGFGLAAAMTFCFCALVRQNVIDDLARRLELAEGSLTYNRNLVAMYEADQGKILLSPEDAEFLREMRIERL